MTSDCAKLEGTARLLCQDNQEVEGKKAFAALWTESGGAIEDLQDVLNPPPCEPPTCDPDDVK